MAPPAITPLDQRAVTSAADVMVAAFMADPAFTHVLPQAADRRHGLRAILTVALRDARREGVVDTVSAEDAPVAVAVWQAPGRYPMTGLRQLRAAPQMAALAVRIGSGVRRLARLGDAVDARFPADPVWYLQALAVHPDHQGTGLGGALLTHGLTRADRDGSDTYLETGKAANVGYYQRLGFTVVDAPDEVFAGGPPMWLMRRPAAI